MAFILKYTAVCVGIIIVIALVVTFAGSIVITEDIPGMKALTKDETENQKIQNRENEASEGYLLNFNFNGSQSQVIEKIYGEAVFNLVYPGSQRFTANLLHRDGTFLALITDSQGPYNRIQVINVTEAGPYLLDVKTSGEWSLSRR